MDTKQTQSLNSTQPNLSGHVCAQTVNIPWYFKHLVASWMVQFVKVNLVSRMLRNWRQSLNVIAQSTFMCKRYQYPGHQSNYSGEFHFKTALWQSVHIHRPRLFPLVCYALFLFHVYIRTRFQHKLSTIDSNGVWSTYTTLSVCSNT